MRLREAWTASILFSSLIAAPLVESPLDQADGEQVYAQSEISSIYGQDDRKDLYQVDSPTVLKAAKSVVLLAEKSSIIPHGKGEFIMDGEVYGESLGLCRSERFWYQPRIGFCTGVLVRENVVLTAGHCIVSQRDCDSTRFVFDVALTGEDEIDMSVSAAQVRNCSRIIKRQNRNSGLDYALIELDRPVRDRHPIHLSTNVTTQSKVFMVGHPLGLPAKYSGLARIVRETDLEWITDLDSSAGNSGSPVFESQTGALIGILTAGEDGDFDRDARSCKISKSCSTKTCFGEVVLKAQAIRQNSGF